jgi:hypothetical protein
MFLKNVDYEIAFLQKILEWLYQNKNIKGFYKFIDSYYIV